MHCSASTRRSVSAASLRASSARLRSSTLTRGSPSRPERARLRCGASTSARTRVLGHAARARDARDLVVRRGRRDVRVEPAARRRHEIDRDRRRVAGIGGAQRRRCAPRTASRSAGIQSGPGSSRVERTRRCTAPVRWPTAGPRSSAGRRTAARSAPSRRRGRRRGRGCRSPASGNATRASPVITSGIHEPQSAR